MHNVNKFYISTEKNIQNKNILNFTYKVLDSLPSCQHLCFFFHNFCFELFIKNNIDDLVYCLIGLFLQKRL